MGNTQEYIIKGIKLRCQHCDYSKFNFKSAILNTSGMTFLDLAFLNKQSDIYVCGRCGFLHWFTSSTLDGEYDPDDLSEESPCLECGAVIPADMESCKKCGWSYKLS